jgi:uncharacterized protein YaaN involved in tellurite resistance
MNFSMEVVNAEALKAEIVRETEPVSEEVAALTQQAEGNVAQIMELDLEALEKRQAVLKGIDTFGLESMRGSTRKNALLQTAVVNFSKMGEDGGAVGKGLLDLQREIKDLDPSLIDFTKTGLLGKIFNPVRAYFAKYQKSDKVISDIVTSLEKGKATLKNDNTTLDIEQQALRELTKKLAKEIKIGSLMDESLAAQLAVAENRGEELEKVKFIQEEILFPLRQRLMDMQQMIVVNQQGIIAIEVVKRNNKELIRGVERAQNVTISALKTAVIVASALYNQKIVLEKIQRLNETTNELISGTSKMLKEQGAEIHKQAMESSISVETLKTAFADVLTAMEAINTYKHEALPRMKETIQQFQVMAVEGEAQIQRLEQGNRLSLT